MTQTNAIASTSLRTLPLPGRNDGDAFAESAAPVRNPPIQNQTTQAIGATAGRNASHAENIIVFASMPVSLAQTLQFSPYTPRGGLRETRQPLADHVVGFLLSANEIADKAAPAERSGNNPAIDDYQNAAAGFPRISDSLFRIAS